MKPDGAPKSRSKSLGKSREPNKAHIDRRVKAVQSRATWSALAEFGSALATAVRIVFFHLPNRAVPIRFRRTAQQRQTLAVVGYIVFGCALYACWLLLSAARSVPPFTVARQPKTTIPRPAASILPPFPRIPENAALAAKLANNKAAYGEIDTKLVKSYMQERLHAELFDELSGPREEWFDTQFATTMRLLYHALDLGEIRNANATTVTEAKKASTKAKVALDNLLKKEAPGGSYDTNFILEMVYSFLYGFRNLFFSNVRGVVLRLVSKGTRQLLFHRTSYSEA